MRLTGVHPLHPAGWAARPRPDAVPGAEGDGGSGGDGAATEAGLLLPSASMDEAEGGVAPGRRLAVRLLVAFMGALLGSWYSADKFAEAVLLVRACCGVRLCWGGSSAGLTPRCTLHLACPWRGRAFQSRAHTPAGPCKERAARSLAPPQCRSGSGLRHWWLLIHCAGVQRRLGRRRRDGLPGR